MLANVFLLENEHRVVLAFENGKRIARCVEGRLVSDDEVVAASDSAFQNVERRHHRQGDSLHSRLRIARLERVDRRASHLDASVLLDSRDYLSCSRGRLRTRDAKRCDEQRDQ